MSINILTLDLTNQIKAIFETELVSPVELIYFYNPDTCETCEETGQLLDEITTLSNKLHISKYVLDGNQPLAEKYNVHLAPGLVVAGGGNSEITDFGIRFSGVPAGYEFGSLILAIILVSRRDSGLKPDVRTQLKEIKQPVRLQVFVTPT
jgi:alkyl hydroperoxide reductase subunit AhpF